ncbi:MAG: 30S ribosome-binding factor RbfA [Gammaproteobacteria bacterium]|nr:30S ribosome-binding factor RbfA [Gammaproteobacteria bacterium]
MPREFPRSQRLGGQILRSLSELIRGEIEDPRLQSVTLTEVKVSRDLSHARVYFGLFDPGQDVEAAQAGLGSAAGFLRARLAQALTVRHVPELHFEYDQSAARGARLDALIAEAVGRDKTGGSGD